MTYLQATILGFIQGATEFLPVSSSGHLYLAKHYFSLEVPLLFDITLHMATLLVVIFFFRKKIASLFLGTVRYLIKKGDGEDTALAKQTLMLIIATFFTAILAFPIEKMLPELSLKAVSGFFIFTGVILLLTFIKKREKKKIKKEVGAKEAILIGLSQGVGVFPGVSRSGITISTGFFLGLDRESAGEFSFILSIPIIFGAFLLKLSDFEGMSETLSLSTLLVATLVAMGTGFFALKFLVSVVKKGKFGYFAFYLIPLGVFTLLLS